MLRPYWSARPYRSEVPQYLLRRGGAAEEHMVAQPVERHAQRREPFRRSAVDAGDTEPLGQAVLRGEPIPLPAHLVVVGQVGPALAAAPGLDVIREQPRGTEAVIAQMHAQQQSPLAAVGEAPEGLPRV